mgnify:FL=1
MGSPIFPNDENLISIMQSRGVKSLLVSPLKNESIRNNPDIVEKLMDAGIHIFMFSGMQEWNGKDDLDHRQLKEVDIEDLLPRDKIEIDLNVVEKQLTGNTILVTGAAGSIGSEIVRQVAQFRPKRLVLIDQAETPLHDIRLMMARQWPNVEAETIVSDICMKERMEELFDITVLIMCSMPQLTSMCHDGE